MHVLKLLEKKFIISKCTVNAIFINKVKHHVVQYNKI